MGPELPKRKHDGQVDKCKHDYVERLGEAKIYRRVRIHINIVKPRLRDLKASELEVVGVHICYMECVEDWDCCEASNQ